MKLLIVGSGGREHALAWKLSQEAEVIASPGNPGIAQSAKCFPIPASDHPGLVGLAQREQVDLVVVGPENPLLDGLADAFRAAGIPTFGPGADGAMLEGSKAFSKQLMRESGVPTAAFEAFTEPRAAHAYVDLLGRPLVVKASGPALGKGVIVAKTTAEAHEAIDEMLTGNAFGHAGETIVIEECLDGPEFSLLTLCSDRGILSLPVAQDYKRALDGDRGPNTGGMGSISPTPWIAPETISKTEHTIVKPILSVLKERGISFRGLLFSGLMMHGGEPYCLEFNVRFGDPEIQSLVLRIGKGFSGALAACANGREIQPIEILDNAAVTVVVASGGYPNSYEKGKTIEIGELPDGVHVFHAGTAESYGNLVTNGGRVVAVSASAADLASARSLAYAGAREVHFEGAYSRQDIASGLQELRQGRV